MTPAARAQAAIQILDRILGGDAAEPALLRWSRGSRFAGSGDRAAVRDLVFDSLRRRSSRAALGGALTGRGLILGMCYEESIAPDSIFLGEGHAPAALTASERAAGHQPAPAEALDLPVWIQPEWTVALRERAAPVALALRERAPVWLRVNPLRGSVADAWAALAQDGIATAVAVQLDTALCVTEGARKLAASRAYLQGLVELQDLSPQLACAALPMADSILDYCAGGGGKALALAAKGAPEVTAHDIDAARMNDLPVRAERAGARIRIAPPGQVRGQFDLVVADVPCSGSGTWRRTPGAKWRLEPADLDRLVAVQAQILDRVAGFVTPGGLLAYMTCSLIDRENDDQIAAFTSRTGFEVTSTQTFTPLEASDGFYLALMRCC